MKIVYVILHYLAGDDTIACAHSILDATKGSGHTTHIVIIDNGSPNDSYSQILQVLGKNPQVTLLQSSENLGFARGNNLGFSYAKNQLNADFIVMLNNDTLLSQTDFNEILVDKYVQTHYGVLGPDIVTADGCHQNPGSKQSWSLQELRLKRLKLRIRSFLTWFGLDASISRIIESQKEIYRKQTLAGDVEHTILHGACWIFSPEFISRFDGLCPDTFLYMEEDILKLQADRYGFTMRYTDQLQIFHKEDIATNMAAGSTNAKLRRKYHHMLQSSLVYSRMKQNQ